MMNNKNNQKLPEGFQYERDEDVRFKGADEKKSPPSIRRGPMGNMGSAIEKPKHVRETVPRLLSYFSQEKRLLIMLIIAVMIVTIGNLFAPAMQGSAIDLISQHQWDQLSSLLIALLCVYAVLVGCNLLQSLLAARLSQRLVRRMRHDLFAKITQLPIKYLDTHSSGDVMSRMTNDVENISNTVSQSVGSMISGVLTIIGTIGIMLHYCWQLTLITMLTVVMVVVVTNVLSKIMRKVYRKRSAALGRLNGHTEEMITGYQSVVAYNRQPDMRAEFDAASNSLKKISIKAEILGGSMGPIMNCITNIGFVIVAAFGGYFALQGLITIGVISAFIIYARQFSRPLNEIAQLFGSLQTALAGAERVFELIDQPDEDNQGELPMEDTVGAISFQHVDFGYTDERQVLYDFTLDVKPGQKIALVGATGSGKTTVVNLLMRFYPLNGGQILIDGVDIHQIRRDELRKNTAVVLQDTALFSDTIAANIKYANEDAPDAQMIDAARLSNSAYFIDRLPNKYQTFLRHAGANLSQGQLQLLAIARAVLADPKILILDEATSSVDTRTEKNIQDAMVKLMANRTSLIIAHRLSTVRDADSIVVLDQGRIVEMGDHETLLEKKGRYYHLYMTQFEGNAT